MKQLTKINFYHFNVILVPAQTFSTAKNLKSHEKIHSSENSFECVTCNKKFARKRYLSAHEKNHTVGHELNKCDVCGKVYSNSSSLFKHKKYHTSKKLFNCQTCGKSFYETTDLKIR